MTTSFRPLLCLIFATGTLRAAEPQRPNVLLIVSDDLTACLGSYGNQVCQTPNLDRLAREGVRFDRAYCQYPVCGPSRDSFMSGLYPYTTNTVGNAWGLGAYKRNPKLARHPSIAELLKDNGYFSARISKIFHLGVPGGVEKGGPDGDDPASWDWTYNPIGPETFSPGKLELLSPKSPWHYGSNFTRIIVPDEEAWTQADVMSAAQAVSILQNRAGARPHDERYNSRPKVGAPFFLGVGFVRPHVPLVAPARFFKKYPEGRIKLPAVPAGDLEDLPGPVAYSDNERRYGMSEEQQRQATAAYYAAVSFMDEQVGKLLDALDRLHLRKNTIILFTSDHGYNLGEHHAWQKGHLWEESARVPLLISAPGFERSAGRVARAVVELVDLYPTIAELVGMKDRMPANLHGLSLRPLLENPERKDWAKTGAFTVMHRPPSMGGIVGESVRTNRWRYTRWGEAGEELYDHEGDPQEFTNLAKNPAHAATLAEMRKLRAQIHERATSGANP